MAWMTTAQAKHHRRQHSAKMILTVVFQCCSAENRTLWKNDFIDKEKVMGSVEIVT